jgi:hypothetical protein
LASSRISRASWSSSRFASRLAFAWTFVPSTAITPIAASPDRAHNLNTSPNNPANAGSWRSLNRAIVA